MTRRQKPRAFRRGRRRIITLSEFDAKVSTILLWAKEQALLKEVARG